LAIGSIENQKTAIREFGEFSLLEIVEGHVGKPYLYSSQKMHVGIQVFLDKL
jgi:hypothetical protein